MKIYATADGTVVNRIVQVGNLCSLAIQFNPADPAEAYIIANVEETRLANTRAVYLMRVRVDALPKTAHRWIDMTEGRPLKPWSIRPLSQ